jgi:hypothetical protein
MCGLLINYKHKNYHGILVIVWTKETFRDLKIILLNNINKIRLSGTRHLMLMCRFISLKKDYQLTLILVDSGSDLDFVDWSTTQHLKILVHRLQNEK